MSSSNSNSLGNGNSPFKAPANSLVPISTRLFPESYPFEPSEEFRTACEQNVGLPLLASHRLAIWQKTVGDPGWEKEVAEVEAANKLALAEHEQEIRKTTAENHRRMEANHDAEQAYNAAVIAYERACKELPAREEMARQQAIETVKRKCHAELIDALDGQGRAIDQALLHARDIANEEKRTSQLAWWRRIVLAIGVITLPTIVGASICAFLACFMRLCLVRQYRRRLAEILNTYNYPASFVKTSHKRVLFLLRKAPYHESMETPVYSPVQLIDAPASYRNGGRDVREDYPLGQYNPDSFAAFDFDELLLWMGFLFVAAMPGVGLLVTLCLGVPLEEDLKDLIGLRTGRDEIQRHRKEKLTALLIEELHRPEVLNPLVERQLGEDRLNWPAPPSQPRQAARQAMLGLPDPPALRIPNQLTAPDSCFDSEERRDFSHILKGSLVYDSKHVGMLSRYRIFEGDCVRPYFMFGGVPISLSESGPHILVVGTAGAGKTTVIRRIMSSLLPLTRRQAEEIISRAPKVEQRLPNSADEWSRSRTHQAVVYNAKGEYLNYLKAFGFDQDIDLFSFDPTDPNGYAWDVAADIDDRTSIEQFAEQLIPQNSSAKRDDALEMWLSTARGAVVAAIVSLRNAAHAAGRQPDWNLRDLVQTFSTDERFLNVLQWHDTPQEMLSRYFKLAGPQQSSILVTLREAVGKFSTVANRWHDLQQRGRVVSLKHWARHCTHSVLLLPNTKANVQAYAPLNAALLKALTNIVLQHEYSFYRDKNGKPQCYRRQFVFDEVGHAGKLHDIDRLMGEGRSFGVNCVLVCINCRSCRRPTGTILLTPSWVCAPTVRSLRRETRRPPSI